MKPFARTSFAPIIIVASLIASGCGDAPRDAGPAPADTMVVETMADTVAMTVYDEMGGPNVWSEVPYLRFDFATGNDTTRNLSASHFWNRETGEYRCEMHAGEDSVFVALFDVDTREGDVYLNGSKVDSTTERQMLQRAYSRFINDTYWLLMPVKMMDPGVDRAYVADSSTAEMDVVTLSFEGVGLTPGDQYWVYVDRSSGRVDRWAYRLQGHPRDHVPQPLRWTDYKTIETPGGTISVSERKVADGRVIYTDNVDVPETLPEGAFTDPNPIL